MECQSKKKPTLLFAKLKFATTSDCYRGCGTILRIYRDVDDFFDNVVVTTNDFAEYDVFTCGASECVLERKREI